MSCLSPRNCFVKIGFISFCIIPFRFVSVNFVWHRFFGKFRFVSLRYISFRVSFRSLQVTVTYCSLVDGQNFSVVCHCYWRWEMNVLRHFRKRITNVVKLTVVKDKGVIKFLINIVIFGRNRWTDILGIYFNDESWRKEKHVLSAHDKLWQWSIKLILQHRC